MLQFLLSLADEGDQAKIEHIYHTYHTDMIRFARSKLRHYGNLNYYFDAEDVVQEALYKITKYIHRIDFSLEEKNLKTYIFSIVANECVNHMREVEYCDELCENQSDEDFFEKLHIKDRYAKIVRAIEDLDDKYSIVMLFRYRDEMDVKSIAALLGLPEKTVYTRLLRGKALLLKALPEEAKHE